MVKMRIDGEEIQGENVLEMFVDSFPDMVHSIGADGKILYANRKTQQVLGYTEEELLSMTYDRIYAEEILAAVDCGFDELKRAGKICVESVMSCKNGTEIPVEMISFAVYDDEGNFDRTMSIAREIRQK